MRGMVMDRRRKLIAQAHLAAKRLGLDEETRREAQLAAVGKASCAEMTEAELAYLIAHWNARGSGVTATAPAGGGVGMATGWQLATLERLAFEMGWRDGLKDERLLSFVRRTAKVDRPEWLTREACSKVISGLMRWSRQLAAKGGAR